MDDVDGREYLKCEYNKDGDSYRSPWTNQYFPPIEPDAEDPDYQPIFPSQDLLEMESKANEMFSKYAKLYYDNDFWTSVYFFDTDTNGFGSCWLVKKSKSSFRLDFMLIFLIQSVRTKLQELMMDNGMPSIQ